MYVVYWIHLAEHTDPVSEGYVGITNNLKNRIRYHSSLKTSDNYRVYAALRAGALVTILQDVQDKTNALLIEQKYRPEENIGWNIIKGGISPPSQKGKRFCSPNHGMRNKSHTLKTKQTMSECRKKWVWWNNGKHNVRCEFCPDGYKKGRIVNYKYVLTEESKKNMGCPGKPIITPHGKFKSIREASKTTGMTEDQIRGRLKSNKHKDWYYELRN